VHEQVIERAKRRALLALFKVRNQDAEPVGLLRNLPDSDLPAVQEDLDAPENGSHEMRGLFKSRSGTMTGIDPQEIMRQAEEEVRQENFRGGR
jgi:hypothetical protein